MYGSWLEELVVLGTVSYSSLSMHESRMRVFRCLFSRKAGKDKQTVGALGVQTGSTHSDHPLPPHPVFPIVLQEGGVHILNRERRRFQRTESPEAGRTVSLSPDRAYSRYESTACGLAQLLSCCTPVVCPGRSQQLVHILERACIALDNFDAYTSHTEGFLFSIIISLSV